LYEQAGKWSALTDYMSKLGYGLASLTDYMQLHWSTTHQYLRPCSHCMDCDCIQQLIPTANFVPRLLVVS